MQAFNLTVGKQRQVDLREFKPRLQSEFQVSQGFSSLWKSKL